MNQNKQLLSQQKFTEIAFQKHSGGKYVNILLK